MININAKDYYTSQLTITEVVSNTIYCEYTIYCDTIEEGLEILLDYAIEHDSNIDRNKYINMTLTSEEIIEYSSNDWLDDYHGNGEEYLNFVILQSDCTFKEN